MQPDLLEDIVRFVVTLLVPTLEKRPVIRMIRQAAAAGFGAAIAKRRDELRNPLAFTHAGRNLGAPAIMGKRARFILHWSRRASAPGAASEVARRTAWEQAVSKK